MTGKFTLIYGCMFSGKTTKLLDILHLEDQSKPLIFSPIKNNRAGKKLINTHDGLTIEVVKFNSPNTIISHLNIRTKEIGIDELQFCNDDIIPVIIRILEKGIDIYGTGLDLDYKNNVFGPMEKLRSIADKTVRLQAWCHKCGSLASYTHRIGNSTSLIDPGGAEKYEARCKDCYPY